MLSEPFQEKAALYAAGVMTAEQREQFELVIEFDDELREFVGGLIEVGTAITLAARHPGGAKVPLEAKARILGAIADIPQEFRHEALVMSGPDGLVQWINPAFSAMCGARLMSSAERSWARFCKVTRRIAGGCRMRHAVRACLPCRETILNYHKNGTPYWVDIAITPICGDLGQPLWLVAREREVADRLAA
jgi:PAS domain-containing protein